MEFKNWIMNELAGTPTKGMVSAAVNMIWKVIYIPERPVVGVSEQVDVDLIKSLFRSTSMTPFYGWLDTHMGHFEPGRHWDKITNGSVGYCFFFGNHVVKFTDQQNEAEIAALLREHQIPNVAVRDVVRIQSRGVWAIMQDKVQTTDIPKELQEAALIVGDWIDARYVNKLGAGGKPTGAKSPFTGSRTAQDVSAELFQRYDVNEYGWVCHAYVEMLLDLIQKIEKSTGRLWNDADPGNVGLQGGKVALFDLGFNYPTRKKKVPKIAVI